ncbi:hypothetical protein [Planococcus lenghuensis]|uniref:Uncharacterized protein n=1 Tax=Planococcus lenghuensis TaxID=2213202 RepID=A0A1Q2L5B3_9BACL|nr:hypothetical protein [Planococcus lenghuensis]AQQ55591.1 hypothetical protein B0X71_20680 [Planococcus lenghuensis]
MKKYLKRIAVLQQWIESTTERWIDRLSRQAIQQAERKYELLYGKPLSDEEKLEIKRDVVLRFGLLLVIPLIILILTLMNRGVNL